MKIAILVIESFKDISLLFQSLIGINENCNGLVLEPLIYLVFKVPLRETTLIITPFSKIDKGVEKKILVQAPPIKASRGCAEPSPPPTALKPLQHNKLSTIFSPSYFLHLPTRAAGQLSNPQKTPYCPPGMARRFVPLATLAEKIKRVHLNFEANQKARLATLPSLTDDIKYATRGAFCTQLKFY